MLHSVALAPAARRQPPSGEPAGPTFVPPTRQARTLIDRGVVRGIRQQHGPGADGRALPALATVVEDEEDGDARVFVVLYEVSENDEEALDHWDGVTLGYRSKLRVRVATQDGDVLAWLYVLNDYEGGLPSARYLGIMADAAEAAGAPAEYVHGLRTRPCSSLGR